MHLKPSLFALAWVCGSLPALVQASDTSAVTFSSVNPGYYSGGNSTSGYAFTVSSPVQVTALSYFDLGSDGLVSSIPVGLWNDAGTLLAQATVPGGTSAPLQDGFRVVRLTLAVVLMPGQTYVVGGRADGTDPVTTQVKGFASAPQITFLQDRFGGGTGSALTYPNYTGGTTNGYGDFGGSFLFAVPEPKAWLFLIVMPLAMGLVRLYRRCVMYFR